ncbi:hypothetical protein TNCV_1345761 [Trichonephila clavipes]|nr:hypothetical protein TNCV_1345761 [Trichonephila clavipes]
MSPSQYGGYVPRLVTEWVRVRIPNTVAAVTEWRRYRIVAGFVTTSSPVPLKTRLVGERCKLDLSRAQTSSFWCGS